MRGGSIQSVLLAGFLIVSCSAGNPGNSSSESNRPEKTDRDSFPVVNDATVLNFFFGDSLAAPFSRDRDTIYGNTAHHEAVADRAHDDSLVVTCDTLLYFTQGGTNYCFIPMTGECFSNGSYIERHYFLALKKEKDRWVFADSVWNSSLPRLGSFKGYLTRGPYILFEHVYETPCEAGATARGKNYIAFFNGSFAASVNYFVETSWSDSCSMSESAKAIKRKLEIEYDSNASVLSYTEAEEYHGHYPKENYLSTRTYLCYDDTCFITRNILQWDWDKRTDTVYTMNEEAIDRELVRLKNRKPGTAGSK